MPHHPFIFFVKWGRVDTSWLYLPAFHMCVTRGPLLHHEKNFSYYQARTRVYVDDQRISPFLTLIIPHHLGFPEAFHLSVQDKHELPSRAKFSDHVLPRVDIYAHRVRVWQWDRVNFYPWTEIQAASFARLQESWDASKEIMDE